MELYHLVPGVSVVRRFILDRRDIGEQEARITGDLFKHMAKVLRLKPGTMVVLGDGEGSEYEGIIESIGAGSLVVRIVRQELLPETEPSPRITIYQGLPKGEKLDFILQKCTELGAAGIVPFAASRSIVKIDPHRSAGRLERWQKIVAEAARQSRRPTVPAVTLGEDLGQVLQGAHHSVKLLLWEEEQGNLLRQALDRLVIPEDVGVLVGPEGGFSPEEAAAASAAGFTPVSLGKRIVRTETAALIVLAILQFHWGDLG